MKCDDIESLLYDYVTARLGSRERESVEVHLEECQVCRGKLDTLQQTLPLLDEWTPPTLQADFADRVLERVDAQQQPWWQKVIDKLVFPVHYKLPLEGLAVAALVFLVIIVYRGKPVPEIETSPRGVTIETEIVRAKKPIAIETRNIKSAVTKLLELIKANDGVLVRRVPVEAGMEVTFRVKPDKDEVLLGELYQLGKVQMEKEGYKDSDGNIVIILRKR